VHQLTSNGTIQASYLATYTRMSEQAEYKNNQLKKLQHKLQFYETVIIESHDEIFITDGNDKTIFANPAIEVSYGLTVLEMLGKSVWEHDENGIYYPAIVTIVLKEKKKITINQETATGIK
jgi:transcriptional regulator with PAS, ATPase and Fis domain